MVSLDLAMPLALFLVVVVAMTLNKRVEGKLMSTVQEKTFQVRDIILLIIFMAIVVSVIAYTSLLNPGAVFQNILLIIFLTSYTMLLFTFSYVFSNMTKIKAQRISLGFGVASLAAALVSLIGTVSDNFTIYRVTAFVLLAAFCFGTVLFEQKKTVTSPRWYVAAQPPAIFLLLMVFFNFLYSGAAQVWYPLLMDIFGLTFAILIILYLSSLFSWKTVGFFAVLLTMMDIFLVIGTGTMVEAASQFTGLGLPVLVYLPNIPLIPAVHGYISFFGFAPRGLGLGDFFFAGVLAVQTLNKFGKKTGYITVAAMAIAFGIWEAFLPEILQFLDSVVGRNIGGFPGTLMIISGWAPVVVWKFYSEKNKNAKASAVEMLPEQPSLPVQ